jgi:short-subunit dehydrogenase
VSGLAVAGRVAVVTGASSGIGRATAVALAERGGTVVAVARRAAELDDTIAACRPHAPASIAVVADLADGDAGERIVAAAEQGPGPVDIVVNNAGVSLHRSALDTPPQDVERVLQVNFLSAVRVTMAALPGMVERRRGSIVNVTSVAGYLPNPKESAYGASKAALHLWSHGLGVDLAGTGVHVGVLSPGPIDTPIWDFDETPSSYQGKKHPPEVVAAAIVRMIEKGELHRTVPRRYGFPGFMFGVPLLGRQVRKGLIAFERKGQRTASKT